MTNTPDPERQTRGVWLMLTIFGVIVCIIGWFELASLIRLLR